MTPPPPRAKPTEAISVDTIDRLARIETQLEHLTTSITSLVEQSEAAEAKRETNWLEYTKAHTEVVATATGNTQKIASLESSVNKLAIATNDLKDLHEKDVDDINKKIDPLLLWHKILLWVALFFASSVGALIWALVTHSVELVHK